MNYTNEHLPRFTKDSYRRLKGYLMEMGIEVEVHFPNPMYYMLFTHWNHLTDNLNKIPDPVQVLILSDFDIHHANMIKDHLTNSLPHKINVRVYSKPTIDYGEHELWTE